MKEVLSYAVSIALCAASAASVMAQEYPTRPIRLVVGFSPGGNSDVSARLVGARMSEALGTSVVVDNRTGAAGVVAARIVAHAPADGYTLAWSSQGALVISQIMDKAPPYKTETAFAPITRTFTFANALIVQQGFPAKSVNDVVALAKQKPGELNYGTQGIGSAGHLAGQMLQNVAHIKLAHVPYKGGADVITALLGGEVRVGFAATTTAANIRNRIHILAVTSRERDPSLPDVPSIEEAGLTGYDATFWFGLLAPAGTPAPVIERLNAVVRDVLKDPKVVQNTRRQGLHAASSSPQQFAALMKSELQRWGEVITER
jgi:tripartite-type tricarboxylate transporter receptor subunit TctC